MFTYWSEQSAGETVSGDENRTQQPLAIGQDPIDESIAGRNERGSERARVGTIGVSETRGTTSGATANDRSK